MIIGRRLNDRYKILETIGGGGMAHVYRAKDMILNRHVAVKVLRPEFSDDDEFIKRFHREAQAATSLNHEHIVSIYDVGEEDNIYYIVMEYVEGMTLKKFIQRYAPLSVDESLRIMKQLASAMGHAHDNDIVHRDIKPQNILMDESGNVKITDFGIAMALSSTTITHTNSVLGSVHYLSPEQARGGLATNKSDIYSLGIVLFELVTGRLPFSGESAVSVALKHLQSETPSPRRWNPDLPQSVENIILKATAKDPFHRYAHIEQMEEDLESALDPSRINEQPFRIPEDDDEATKAIPVITDRHLTMSQDETLIHNKKQAEVEQTASPAAKPPKKRWRKAMTIVFIVLLLLGAAAAAAFTIIPDLLAAKDVKIPDVVAMDYEDALNELTALGLKVKHENQYHNDAPAGTIIATIPQAGATVKEGFTVTVVESNGKEKLQFGNYVGDSFEDAKKSLILKGFQDHNIISLTEESDRPAGEILKQVQPLPGELVLPETERVIFRVSKGPQMIYIPDLTRYSDRQVESFIQNNQLSLERKEAYSDEIAEGLVMAQKPKADSRVKKGSTIEVTFSKGPKPTPPKTKTITILVPFEPEEGQEQQLVEVFIDDETRDIDKVADSVYISEDLQKSYKLVIPYEKTASYIVKRDGQVVDENTFSYEETE